MPGTVMPAIAGTSRSSAAEPAATIAERSTISSGVMMDPQSRSIATTAGSNLVLVCLEEGQVIPPHPEPYAVVFVVLRGEGVITSAKEEHPVKPLGPVQVGKDEDQGIRCTQRMILLGIHEDI